MIHDKKKMSLCSCKPKIQNSDENQDSHTDSVKNKLENEVKTEKNENIEDPVYIVLIGDVLNLNSNLKIKSNRVYEDIFNSLSKLSKMQNLRIINNLTSKNNGNEFFHDMFRYNDKVILAKQIEEDDGNEKTSDGEKNLHILKCNNDKITQNSKIIHLVFGNDADQIRKALETKPNSKFIFLNVSCFILVNKFLNHTKRYNKAEIIASLC